jgi:hypothetical protein
MAALDMLYGTKPGCAIWELMEEMLMIAPPLASAFINLTICFVISAVPLMFTAYALSSPARQEQFLTWHGLAWIFWDRSHKWYGGAAAGN